MSNTDQNKNQPDRPKGRNWAWITFFLVIIVLALVTGYAALMGGLELARTEIERRFDQREAVSLVEIIIDGQRQLLRPEDAVELFPGLLTRMEEQQAEVSADINQEVQARLDEIFEPIMANVPKFTDWYYSLAGEYTRYLKALTSNLSGFIAGKLQELVLDSTNFEQDLDGLHEALSGDLAARLQDEARETVAILRQQVADLSVPQQTDDYRGSVEDSVDLGQALTQHMAISQAELGQKALTAMAATGVGAAVAKGLGAVVVKQVVAKVMGGGGMKLAMSLLGKLAAKGAVKGGGAATAAVTGTVICSPGGPAAVLCGLAAGTAVWLGVDLLFLSVDEQLNRAEFEAEIRTAIGSEREALEKQLIGAYQDAILQQYAEIAAQLTARSPDVLTSLTQRKMIPAEGGMPTGQITPSAVDRD